MLSNSDITSTRYSEPRINHELYDRIFPLTRLYEQLLITLLALLPVLAAAYIYFFQDSSVLFIEHGLHEVAIGVAILQGVFISYVTWRCYLSSGEPQLRWLTLSFIGFTLVYGLHGLFTPLSHDHMALFLLYGPVSRLLMASFMLTGLLTYGSRHHSLQKRGNNRFWWSWIAAFLLLDILVGWVAITQSDSMAIIRIGVEVAALLFILIGIAFIFFRRVQSWMMLLYLISLAYFAESSLVFIFAKPWNQLWWLAHLISAAGFMVLSFGVIRAFHTTGAVSLVFSQEEVIKQLAMAKAVSEKNELNLRAILNNSPFMIWLKDTEGQYLAVNKAFAAYLRLSDAQQAEGKTDLDLQPDDLAKKYRNDDVEVMVSRKAKRIEESSFDGKKIHWVETYKTPILNEEGNVQGTVGFSQDISERKQIETQRKISAVAFESNGHGKLPPLMMKPIMPVSLSPSLSRKRAREKTIAARVSR